ncbi:MAG: indole-3-glycerol phosphate synthase TrpC [Candidatus Aminicenantes bacterium]
MSDFLEIILAHKRKEWEEKQKSLSFSALWRRVQNSPPCSSLSHSLVGRRTIIAEIKRASPSKGAFLSGGRIKKLASIYQEYGASAISVVTEEGYFHGSLKDLRTIKNCVHIPVLRKDFIIDEYQILESRESGADAVLLIASLLGPKKLKKFLNVVAEQGMEAVVEINTQDELEKALEAEAKIIGINNRDLRTLRVDLNTSKSLLPLIPDSRIKIVESGLRDEDDLSSYHEFRVNGFLIGEALVTASHPEDVLKRFCSVLREK